MHSKKLILIDLDGVLNEYSGSYNKNVIPEIKNGADKFLQGLSGKNEYTYSDFKKAFPNIILTREEMRKKPPHILITNYTMLEYQKQEENG